MKISHVATRVFDDPHVPQLLVVVEAEDGLKGVGECWWGISPLELGSNGIDPGPAATLSPIVAMVDDLLGPFLLGKDEGRIEWVHGQMTRFFYRYGDEGIFRCALSGLDMALWDLLGKRLGAPVAQLLGGTVRQEIRAYASLPPYRDAGRIRHEVIRAKAAGFKGIKLHEIDPAMADAARSAAGPETAIMFDVNGRFTPREAVDIGRRLKEANIYWFEEPVWPMRDHRAMARVKRETGVRIAAGENEPGLDSFHRLMTSEAVDTVMPEISKIGGLTTARQISVLARLFNLPLSPHGFRIGPALYANLHWAMSCMCCDWIEVPWLPDNMDFPVHIPLPPMAEGKLMLPPGPGLGLPERCSV